MSIVAVVVVVEDGVRVWIFGVGGAGINGVVVVVSIAVKGVVVVVSATRTLSSTENKVGDGTIDGIMTVVLAIVVIVVIVPAAGAVVALSSTENIVGDGIIGGKMISVVVIVVVAGAAGVLVIMVS